MSFRCDWRTDDLGVEGGDGGTQALGDHLRVMLKSSLRVRVPQVALHVLDSCMALYVRRRRAAECLECEIVNPGFLRQRFQVPF